ncbi:MAG: hypothetical protein M1819_005825 [Sarea resinae]|nr:MAG: hypothetical protein M1819_005825 [Sarea resinae]
MGYLSNRRHVQHLTEQGSFSSTLPVKFSTSSTGDGTSYPPKDGQGRSLKRTSSQVRLSLSLDGKAEVVADGGSSPPHSQPCPSSAPVGPIRSLQRSYSDASTRDSANFLNPVPWPRRATSGRSRDSRTWEFYCDSDARNSLTAKAEEEQSGSAVSAIGLLRSRNSNLLSQNKNKRNALLSRPESAKRVKSTHQGDRKKLARSSSSAGRLQAGSETVKPGAMKVTGKNPKSCSQPTRGPSPSGDSDKENWLPGTHTAGMHRRDHQRHHVEQQIQHGVLKDNDHIPSHSNSLEAALGPSRRRVARHRSKAHSDIPIWEENEEVADVMAGSPVQREEEDLDCVQNLLSLSQGNWR